MSSDFLQSLSCMIDWLQCIGMACLALIDWPTLQSTLLQVNTTLLLYHTVTNNFQI